jgi:hypothetical protein
MRFYKKFKFIKRKNFLQMKNEQLRDEKNFWHMVITLVEWHRRKWNAFTDSLTISKKNTTSFERRELQELSFIKKISA